MEAAPSFRFLATVVAGGVTTTISGEAVAPDKVHQTVMSADGQLTETTYIGSDVWVKDTTGTWHSAPGTASAATSTATFAALSTATALNVSSADVLFELKGDSSFIQSSSGPQDVAGDAVITDGTITKLTYGTVGSAGSMLVTIEYSDVGAALTVEPPAA
jgi:hypothetical protein